ncbi:hypothetical protein BBJ28_00003643 [Nothophytophthora sp. Chile5]|nr:hypothetical protein BBJ28_00003643 [Nothophytophthora sp. Chile5]
MVLQLFVNGPPGSGKTTLAKLLCKEFHLELVATGELLRENMAAQTASGRTVQRCIAAKMLVPDGVVLDMVAAKVATCASRGRAGWVLDSFPRTIEQAEALMQKSELCPAIVLLLELPEAACMTRICGRRFDPVTGEIFHSPINLPSDAVARARLTRRRDDARERLAPRFEAYRTFGIATNELFASQQGVVHRLDASKSPAALLEDVSALLHSLVARNPLGSLRNSDSNNNSNNNQLPTVNDASAKKRIQQRPETIEETEEESGDDDMQQYQYDWEEDEESVGPSQCQSPQKQIQQQTEDRVTDGKPEKKSCSPSSTLPSSLMAALPLPTLPTRTTGLNLSKDEAFPPPPAPMFRPLPPPSNKFKSAIGPIELAPQVSSVHSSISVRSSSGSSVRSNSSTTLEAAAASVDMETFKELLLDGFEAVKHGRRGRPHARLIFTDLDFKRVFWQKAVGAASKVGKGKHARLEQSIALGDVVQVTRGMKTTVLKRSGDVARYERYVSLVTPIRTLDLELPNAQLADFLQRGFDQLLHG